MLKRLLKISLVLVVFLNVKEIGSAAEVKYCTNIVSFGGGAITNCNVFDYGSIRITPGDPSAVRRGTNPQGNVVAANEFKLDCNSQGGVNVYCLPRTAPGCCDPDEGMCSVDPACPYDVSNNMYSCMCSYVSSNPFPYSSHNTTGANNSACDIEHLPVYTSNSVLTVSGDTIVNPKNNEQIPAQGNIKYIEFNWAPSRDLNKFFCTFGGDTYMILEASQSFVVDDPNKLTSPQDGNRSNFLLPGVSADRFQLDFTSLSCGTHHWRVDGNKKFYTTVYNQNSCPGHTYACYAYRTPQLKGPSYTFTKLCCNTPPTIQASAPVDNVVFPATTELVSPTWAITSNACPTMGAYHRLSIADISETPPAPVVYNIINAQNQPDVSVKSYYRAHPVLPNCNGTTPRVYEWYVETANLGPDPANPISDRDPEGTDVFRFSVAPDVVTVNPYSPPTCYSPGPTLNIGNISFSDVNRIDDTFLFELIGTNPVNNRTTTRTAGTCTTVEESTICNDITFTDVAEDLYTLYVSNTNACHVTQERLNATGTSTEFSATIVTGQAYVGILNLIQETSSEFEITLDVDHDTFPFSNFSVQFQEAPYDPVNNICPGTGYTDIGGVVDCGFGTLCRSGPFLPSIAGRYCYRAQLVNLPPGAAPCGATITPDLDAKVYLVNTYLLTNPTGLACQSATPPSGDGIEAVRVDFRHSLNPEAVFFQNTDAGGTATFGFWVPGTTTAGTVSMDTLCGDNCLTDRPDCSSPYIECGGNDLAKLYGPAAIRNLTLSMDMDLATAPIDKFDYNMYMRVDFEENPEEWLSSAYGDVYAPGMNLSWCSLTTEDGAKFDGGLAERPEGSPTSYGKPGLNTADSPYTGGFVFSLADVNGIEIEDLTGEPRYYLSEPDAEGRYAMHLNIDTNADPPELLDLTFRDMDFELDANFTEVSGLLIPPNAVDLQNNALSSGGVYRTDDFTILTGPGGYELAGGVAVIYYSGDSAPDIQLTGNFVNLSGTNGRLIIITDKDVLISPNIGYSCWWISEEEYGCSDTGTQLGMDYGPEDYFAPNVQATFVSYRDITFENNVAVEPVFPDDLNSIRLVKLKGSLIAQGTNTTNGGVLFGRRIGTYSTKYPAEFVEFDKNTLYSLTSLERNSMTPVTGIVSQNVTIQYGY